jgi:glycosyltransferase involved in cell wall biosynthesis
MYGKGSFGYKADWFVELPTNQLERCKTYYHTLEKVIEDEYDIIHYFQRSFFMSTPPKRHDMLTGFDIPLFKLRGKRIAYRFTGWELIDKQIELKNNPYSAFNHGWDGFFDEYLKGEYIEYLRCYCDAFMVVDPMMREHMPEAKIIPRVLRIEDFEEIGIEKRDKPLILHAPTNKTYKGSKYIINALKELKNEGLRFELKLLNKVPFKEALEWYKRADLIVDQILIGWYGVLATECMAMGKPVAVYMRDDLVNTPQDVPVQNINLDNVKDKLRDAIQDFELRKYLSERGRSYVKATHDESVVIPKLIDVYKDIMEKGPKLPSSKADVHYLYLQRYDIEKNKIQTKALAKPIQLLRFLESASIALIRIFVRILSRL